MTSEELGKLRIINRNSLNPFALGASQVETPLTHRQFLLIISGDTQEKFTIRKKLINGRAGINNL